MGSHTHTPSQDPATVQPVDPLHDIDAKKTVLSVVAFTIGVFLSMGLLASAFAYFLEQEQQVKVFDREATELKALRAIEATELSKTAANADGTQRISIEDAMRRLATK